MIFYQMYLISGILGSSNVDYSWFLGTCLDYKLLSPEEFSS